MHFAFSKCQNCSEPLHVTRLVCSHCGTQTEGSFELPPLMLFSPDEIAFVIEFVCVSGSLKEMARRRRVSYPTIRNRLNDIIAKLQPSDDSEKRKLEILDAVAHGSMSAQEAAKHLKGMSK